MTVFRLLDTPHSLPALLRKTAARYADTQGAPGEVTLEQVSELLAHWLHLGLVFAEGGQYVHVAPAVANQDLLRLDGAGLHGDDTWLVPALAARAAEGDTR